MYIIHFCWFDPYNVQVIPGHDEGVSDIVHTDLNKNNQQFKRLSPPQGLVVEKGKKLGERIPSVLVRS